LRSKPPARRRRDAGFTLLETLVAVAVLAMVLGGVMGTLGWSMRTQTLRLERAWLAELNRSVLEAYLRQPDPAARTGSAPPDWRWRISDVPVTQDNGTTGLREVTVDGWSERRPDLVVSLSTLR
jgi:prepilin-type N-terminal cleavage/methylation domain-containing protein